MKIWMKAPGEILYLFNGGNIDLRNTSPERPIEVNDELGKKLLLPGIVFEVIEKEVVEPVVEPVEKELVKEAPTDDWDNLTWNKKKAFAIDNGYNGISYKTLDLDSWYRDFLKENEI